MTSSSFNVYITKFEKEKETELSDSEVKLTKGQIQISVGQRLRRRRRILGLTQQALAEMVDLRFQQIQKYETGGNNISLANLWKLSEALSVPVGYFYEGLTSQDSSDALGEPDYMSLIDSVDGIRIMKLLAKVPDEALRGLRDFLRPIVEALGSKE